ncbi:RES domain-containing protein [Caenispirillum bisanense]|uniref:RES domain-containing protein n=1 Tax=Caenispirillum bisanense TaxID=414052 RepID=A0A286H2L2_9PROT|nr:RES domain-containing protein [Caenispirillum bisanense]
MRDGDEDPYGPEARYEAIAADDRTFQDEWLALQLELRERSRFFNSEAEDILGRIFGGLESLQTFQKQPVVVTIPPDDPDAVFWRARLFMTQSEAEDALVDPAGSIGPPPPQKARAGRMNPAGVAVFYGSQDIDVCLAELRPPVGSWIVACQFRPLRPLRLLDLPALEAVYEEGSYFDLDFGTRRERAAFLSTFCTQVARPVLPGEEDLGYLPTQVIAEYLADKLHIDGMFYPSPQAGGDRHNVVLFHRAARVRQQLPAEGEEQTGQIEVLEEGIEAVVRVTRMPPAQVAAEKAEALELLDFPGEAWLSQWPAVAQPEDPRTETIEVVAGSVYVNYVFAVTVGAASTKVSYFDVSDWP